MDDPLKYYAKWVNSDTKDYIFYDSIYMKYSEKGKSVRDRKEISDRLQVGFGKNSDCKGEIFEDNGKILKLD